MSVPAGVRLVIVVLMRVRVERDGGFFVLLALGAAPAFGDVFAGERAREGGDRGDDELRHDDSRASGGRDARAGQQTLRQKTRGCRFSGWSFQVFP
jgi:hypothetical protein